MTGKVAILPSPSIPWIDPKSGRPMPEFQRFMTLFAAGNFGPFAQAANDAAAAKAGVSIGGVYQDASTGILHGRVN